MAFAARPIGRLLLTGGYGSPGNFFQNVRLGYGGWGRTQNVVTACESLCRTAIQWLTGKASGVNVLLIGSSTRTDAFGPFWETHIKRSPSDSGSETYAESGSATVYGPWNYGGGVSASFAYATPSTSTGWTLTDWGGIDPTQYDLVCCGSVWRNSNNHAGMDAYLQWGGAIWGFLTPFQGGWEDYGFDKSGYQSSTGSPDYMCVSTSVSEWGGSYQYPVYSSSALTKPHSNTMGGTSVLCGAAFGLWYN